MSLLVDSYGLRNTQRLKRHPLCTCKPVPCFGRFRCSSRRHKGRRSTPYCNGASPGETCDVCWSKGHPETSQNVAVLQEREACARAVEVESMKYLAHTPERAIVRLAAKAIRGRRP